MEAPKVKLCDNPRQNASLLSVLTFWWTVDMFRKGSTKTLGLSDLYKPLEADHADRLGDQLERNWRLQLHKCKHHKNARPSLVKAIFRTFWKDWVVLSLITVFGEIVLRIAQPILLGRLLLYFRYLATGDSQKTISFSYRLGVSTVHQIINETCRAIVTTLMEECMPKPTEAMWKQIAEDFNVMWGFPNCIGALDGKHVTIQAPPNSGSLYFNYKKTYSIVLLALVDAHGNFIAVDVGSYGKSSDGGIFAQSQLGKSLEQHQMAVPDDAPLPGTNLSAPFVIVGDEAYPLKTYLMRPYPGLHLDESKRLFNYQLSLARRISENAFAMLAAWSRMYHRTIHANPENIDFMILASCVLHNYVQTFKEYFNSERE